MILQNHLCKLFEESEARLLKKLEESLCEKLNELRVDLDGVRERVVRLETMINTDKTSYENVISELQSDIEIIKHREEKCSTVSSEDVELKAELNNLRRKIMQQENTAVASELRIDGIPYHDNENLYTLFCSLCSSLNIETPNIKAMYRIRKNDNFTAPTILIKLCSPYDKNYLLRTISNYRRRNKDVLRLFLLSFECNDPFYINENLSQENYKIFNRALKMKKEKRLISVFTKRGIVHVVKQKTDRPVRIKSTDEFDELFRDNNVEIC